MNKLVSLRECARVLGVHPVQLSRWIKRYPEAIKIHRITSRAYAMRPSAVKKALIELGKLKPDEQKIA